LDKISYTATQGATGSLMVVSQSGVTTNVFSVDTGWVHYPYPFGNPTWSPDDLRLAVCRNEGGSSTTIMIFNTTDNGSTWAYADSIKVSGSAYGLDWSRTGTNKLCFGLRAQGSTVNYLYYCDPSSTAPAPATLGIQGWYPTWSPNNSSVMYVNGGLYKNIPLSLSITAVSSTGFVVVKWKR